MEGSEVPCDKVARRRRRGRRACALFGCLAALDGWPPAAAPLAHARPRLAGWGPRLQPACGSSSRREAAVLPRRLWKPAGSPHERGGRSGRAALAARRGAAVATQLWAPLDPPRAQGDQSGATVARILELLVPFHLRRYETVRVVVRSRLGDLVRGRVDAVYLSGDGWQTRAGLTAQRLTVAALQGAALSYGDLLSGKIVLTTPARGWAEAVFDQADFGNFLLYGPVASDAPVVGGTRITFERDGVTFDVSGRRVLFTGWVAGRRTPLVLEAGEGDGDNVSVHAPGGTVEGLSSEALGATLTRFFRTLLLDLAGVELRFAAMSFDERARLRLRLRATIRRIPNPLTDRI